MGKAICNPRVKEAMASEGAINVDFERMVSALRALSRLARIVWPRHPLHPKVQKEVHLLQLLPLWLVLPVPVRTAIWKAGGPSTPTL